MTLRACAAFLLLAVPALAQDAAEEAPELPPAPSYTAPADQHPALHFHGYFDMGAAKAQGNGTSFSSRSELIPADYGVDTFATAVNSRGDVASTTSTLPTNGFLPSSMGIGGHASPFISTIDFDIAYAPEGAKYLAFVRLQVLPRITTQSVNSDLLNLEQAFVKFTPFESQELTVTLGRFDSVFGIEYLENEAPLRTNIIPSLVARYTTGQQLGGKLFYRMEFPSTWSALSLNVACTTNPPVVQQLLPSAVSLSGLPEGTARLGYELNLPSFQIKAGASASRGPRGDQTNPDIGQTELGGDFRLNAGWVSVAGEYVHVQWDEGGGDKAGAGNLGLVSAFLENGGYAFAGLGIPIPLENLRKVTPYFRFDIRSGGFIQTVSLLTDRYVAGVRLDVLGESAFKIEYIWNNELRGAPDVANNVLTSSFVFVY